MFSHRSLFAQMFAIGAVLLLAAGCAQPPDLTLRLSEGDQREAEIVIDMRQEMAMMGNKMTITNDQTMVLALTVESMEADGAARMAAEITGMEVVLDMDTEMDLGQGMNMSEMMKQFTPDYSVVEGTVFKFTLMPDGRVEKVDGTAEAISKLKEDVLAKLPEMMQGMAGGQLEKGIEAQFGNEALSPLQVEFCSN